MSKQQQFVHPLINPESAQHYEMFGKQSIQMLESLYTIDELKIWAEISTMKYRLRIGKKDDPKSELAKIKTYEDYWQFLVDYQNKQIAAQQTNVPNVDIPKPPEPITTEEFAKHGVN